MCFDWIKCGLLQSVFSLVFRVSVAYIYLTQYRKNIFFGFCCFFHSTYVYIQKQAELSTKNRVHDCIVLVFWKIETHIEEHWGNFFFKKNIIFSTSYIKIHRQFTSAYYPLCILWEVFFLVNATLTATKHTKEKIEKR